MQHHHGSSLLDGLLMSEQWLAGSFCSKSTFDMERVYLFSRERPWPICPFLNQKWKFLRLEINYLLLIDRESSRRRVTGNGTHPKKPWTFIGRWSLEAVKKLVFFCLGQIFWSICCPRKLDENPNRRPPTSQYERLEVDYCSNWSHLTVHCGWGVTLSIPICQSVVGSPVVAGTTLDFGPKVCSDHHYPPL